jgi:hypothetical protein
MDLDFSLIETAAIALVALLVGAFGRPLLAKIPVVGAMFKMGK